MSYRSIFGDDLTEYEVEVLIDSGIAASDWAKITRDATLYAQANDRRSTRNFISKALKAGGVAAAGLAAISKLTYSWVRNPSNDKKRLRTDEISPPQKRLRTQVQPVSPTIQEQSLLNLQQNTQDHNMDQGYTGSGNPKGLKETPVDPVRNVSRGPPDSAFASLPYVRDIKILTTGWAYDLGFRMTSPLDPAITQAASIDHNAGAGSATTTSPESLDSADTAQTSARWFDFYSTLYNYYHVVGATWHVTIENLKNEPLFVHKLYYNDEVPPAAATNEDIMCWKDTESHYLGSHALTVNNTGTISAEESNQGQNNVEGAGTAGQTANYGAGDNVGNRGASPILKLSGKYTPGQTRRQIHLDNEVENWTAVTANPSLPERLLLRFRPFWNAIDTNNATNYDRLLNFRVNFRIDYLVEFKELKYGLRWPVERQPVICAINTNIEEDEE